MNEELVLMVETEREIMNTVRTRQKRWIGHILRHELLLKISLGGQYKGRRLREEGLWENNVLGLAAEDGGRKYQL